MLFLRCLDPVAAHADLVAAGGDGLFLFAANSVLRATLDRVAPDLTVHECLVGTPAEWSVHPAFRIARIPTLIRFRAGIEIGRLVEGPCADPAAVTAFLG